jgi:hypothetical protein
MDRDSSAARGPDREPSPPSRAADAARTEGGHLHRCRNRHRWFHTATRSTVCTLPRDNGGGSDVTVVDAAACPVCSGRADVVSRGPHVHRCGFCYATWSHRGVCQEGPVASCPWCLPSATGPDPTAYRGLHLHECHRCHGRWRHDDQCQAPVVSDAVRCGRCERRGRWLGRGLVVAAAALASAFLVSLTWSVDAPSQRVPGAPPDGSRVRPAESRQAATPCVSETIRPAQQAAMPGQADAPLPMTVRPTPAPGERPQLPPVAPPPPPGSAVAGGPPGSSMATGAKSGPFAAASADAAAAGRSPCSSTSPPPRTGTKPIRAPKDKPAAPTSVAVRPTSPTR